MIDLVSLAFSLYSSTLIPHFPSYTLFLMAVRAARNRSNTHVWEHYRNSTQVKTNWKNIKNASSGSFLLYSSCLFNKMHLIGSDPSRLRSKDRSLIRKKLEFVKGRGLLEVRDPKIFTFTFWHVFKASVETSSTFTNLSYFWFVFWVAFRYCPIKQYLLQFWKRRYLPWSKLGRLMICLKHLQRKTVRTTYAKNVNLQKSYKFKQK